MTQTTLKDVLERLPSADGAVLRRLTVELNLGITVTIETAMRRAADAPDATAGEMLADLIRKAGYQAALSWSGGPPNTDRGDGASAPGSGSQSGHAPAPPTPTPLPAGVQAMWSDRRCGLCRAVARLEIRQARCSPCEAAWLGHAPAADWGSLAEHDPELVATIKSGQSKDRFLADLRNRLPETRDPGPLLRVLAAMLADPRGEKVPSSVLATRFAAHVWRRTSGVAADPPVFFNEAEWWAQA